MTWPTTFGSLLGGDQPASLFDGMFNQSAAMIQIPCSASGNNAVSLTPLINCPALMAYNELGGYRFRANGNSSGTVTAQFNSLGFLPVYHADGITQANIGDLANGQEYVLIYSAVLAGGLPGFFLEQAAVGGVSATGLGGSPGGRLTLLSATPVMSSTVGVTGTVFYAPYVNQFIPLWNGSTLQQHNFCSSLSDLVGLTFNMASSANYPANNAFDVFVTLNGGVPVLATVQWTHPGPSPAALRATTLTIFGGILTNSTTATMRLDPATTLSVPANQGTFVGSFYTIGNGQTQWTFGSAASGGGTALFGVCNYYNKCLFNTIVQDNGAPYTYTTGTARQARASAGNQISYIQSDSERAAQLFYNAHVTTAAASGANCITGIGVNSTTSFVAFNITQTAASLAIGGVNTTAFPVTSTGLTLINAMEQGDGVNANTFDTGSTSQLVGNIWL